MGSQWMWVAAAVVGVAQAAAATDRFYPNQTAKSDNGKFRIDAVSPDNPKDGGWGRAFASSFTYTLREVDTGRVVWTRKQEMERSKGSPFVDWLEGSPMRVFVSDTGTVAAYVAGEELIVLDSKTGKKVAEHDLLRLFPPSEVKGFVSQTTAGPMWTQFSWFGFVTVPQSDGRPARELFDVRPYWKTRIIIDVASGKNVALGSIAQAGAADSLEGGTEEARACVRAALDAEMAYADRMIKRASTRRDEDPWEICTAVVMTGQLGFKELVPQLRIVERLAMSEVDERWQYVRPHIRTALRRLGETPIPGYGVALRTLGREKSAPVRSAEERRAGADRVVVSMKLNDMLEIMGHPDVQRSTWDVMAVDYDIDGADPYTLRVMFSEELGEVTSVEKVRPPKYLRGVEREQW